MSKFLADAVQDLCRELGLTDIGREGTAKQSSLSKWSRPGDAQRAVQDVGRTEFAFHTGREKEPWWELTFDDPVRIQILIIENRRNPSFQEMCRNLRVEAHDGEEWIPIYEGRSKFGAFGFGIPLILPVHSRFYISKIRISMLDEGYLHLYRVHALSRESDFANRGRSITFLAARRDGFGERLKALLNAEVLARSLGGKMIFSWEEMPEIMHKDHDVRSAEQTFSKSYLKRHFIDRLELAGLNVKNLPQTARSIAEQIEATGRAEISSDAVLVNQTSIQGQAPQLRELIDFSRGFSEAFNSIEFSEPLEEVRQFAYGLDVPDGFVGVHLRAGDIVYGRYRSMGRYTSKVLPFALAADLIESIRNKGEEVILFGQDINLCRFFKERFGAIVSSELIEGKDFSSPQLAMFDICLMTRASLLYSGNSGFSVAAATISRTPIVDPYTLYSKDRIEEVTLRALEKEKSELISSLQRAFSAWSAVQFSGSDTITDQQLELLRTAVEFDPANHFYRFVLCYENYKFGLEYTAEEEIKKMLSDRDVEWDIVRILTVVHPDGTLTSSPYLPVFSEKAESGFPLAAFVVGVSYISLGRPEEAENYLHIFRNSSAYGEYAHILDEITGSRQ
jgi:hypothetical protein